MTAPISKPRRAASQSIEAAQIPTALLRIETVKAITGFGESTIRRKMAANEFPQPVKDGTRCTRWVAGQVTAWLRERGAGAPPAAAIERQAA